MVFYYLLQISHSHTQPVMSAPVLLLISILAYTLASGLIWKNIRNQAEETGNKLITAFVFAAIAISLHLIYAFKIGHLNTTLNLSLTSMSILISAILTSIFFVSSFFTPIQRLGLLIFPTTAITIGLAALWNSPPNLLDNSNTFFNIHILVSMVAHSILALATLQSILYIYQERQIKKHRRPTLLLALPPLQTMELLFFQMLVLGFILLTLTLLSGAIFSQRIFGQPLVFNHHIVLAISGWLVFAWLLLQRIKNGIRGSQAVLWSACGFILIQLGYFGTKLVTETLQTQ